MNQSPETVQLRSPEPGDLGWVVEQHGRLYAHEYGWNWAFEGLVAGIVERYVQNFQPAKEACWIAVDPTSGARLGSVFVVQNPNVADGSCAKLRMLIVTPQARGQGLGKRLTDTALQFAKSKGYKRMVLWTNSCLLEARGIYERRGFKLTASEPYEGFGKDLVSETWELEL